MIQFQCRRAIQSNYDCASALWGGCKNAHRLGAKLSESHGRVIDIVHIAKDVDRPAQTGGTCLVVHGAVTVISHVHHRVTDRQVATRHALLDTVFALRVDVSAEFLESVVAAAEVELFAQGVYDPDRVEKDGEERDSYRDVRDLSKAARESLRVPLNADARKMVAWMKQILCDAAEVQDTGQDKVIQVKAQRRFLLL